MKYTYSDVGEKESPDGAESEEQLQRRSDTDTSIGGSARDRLALGSLARGSLARDGRLSFVSGEMPEHGEEEETDHAVPCVVKRQRGERQ